MIFHRIVKQVFICVGIFTVFICSSCEQSTEQPEKNDNLSQSVEQELAGGTYRAPLLNNPATLDPAYVQDQYGTAVVQQLFDGLVRFDPYLMVLPALAKSWQVAEHGKNYIFTLHENGRFHNGDLVTADDVVFSLSRLLRVEPAPVTLPHLLKIKGAEEYRQRKTEEVEGLQAISDLEVSIDLEEPHAPFLTALGMYQAKIVPKSVVLELGKEFGKKPVGSGPFKFVSWQDGKSIELVRFPEYYAGKSLLDAVEYKIYPGVEIDQLLADFKNGELDEMRISGNIREELAVEKNLQWFHRPALSLMFYGLQVNHPNLNDPEFRRKLSAAIDRDKLIREVYNDQLDPAYRILPPGMPGVSQEDKPFFTTSAKSAQTVEGQPVHTNHDDVVSLEIVSGSKSAFAQAELSLLRQTWADIGVDLTIRYITDWSEFEAYINSDQVQIYRYAWFADMPDPDSFFYPLFASSSSANFMGYQNEEVNQLILSARGETDPVKRTEIYHEIEALIMESAPIIPLVYLRVDRIYKSHVMGAQPSALGADYMPLHRVWLKKEIQVQ